MKTTKNDLLERLNMFLTKYEGSIFSEWTKLVMDVEANEFVNAYINHTFDTFSENSCFYVDFSVSTAKADKRIKRVRVAKIDLNEVV